MQQPISKTLSYIQTVLAGGPLGETIGFSPIKKLPEVPIWINEATRFIEASLTNGYQFILAEPQAEMTADRLLALYRVTQASLSKPLILVTDQQRHQVRSALMRAHIGLVRTGSFLFAPQFGLHIKHSSREPKQTKLAIIRAESFFQPQEEIFLTAVILHESLRQATSLTQFVTEFARIHPNLEILSPKKLLGQASRAIAHFQRKNLVTVQRIGIEMSIRFSDPEVLWDSLCRDFHALISRTYPVFYDLKDLGSYPISSLSALSRYSDLLPPKVPTVAMSRKQWITWSKKSNMRNQGNPTAYVEVWKTNPKYLQLKDTVNPLLLSLHCRRDPDERVRIAIREMLESFHISPDPLWKL